MDLVTIYWPGGTNQYAIYIYIYIQCIWDQADNHYTVYHVNYFRLGPGKVQNFEVRNSRNRRCHENRGEISCRTVVARGRGLVSLTIS